MKSAYELTMERLEKVNPSYPALTPEQKEKLADIDTKYQAKIAEVKILAEQEKKTADSHEQLREIESRMMDDIRRLETERDNKKAEIRKSIK